MAPTASSLSTAAPTCKCAVQRRCSISMCSAGQLVGQSHLRQQKLSALHTAARGRSSAVVPRAQTADNPMRTPRQSDQAGAAGSKGDLMSQKARQHLEDMRAEDNFAAGIWEAQAAIAKAITSDSSVDGDRLQRLRDDDTQLFFPGKDGLSSFDIDVYRGSGRKLAWVVAPRSVVASPFSSSPPDSVDGKFALGGRVNAYVSSHHSYAPNLDVELYHWPWCKSLFMYLNLVPRRSLLQFPEDIGRMYQTSYRDCATYQNLISECEQRCKDSAWQRFTSKDPFVRAIAGGNSMMYQMPATPENLARVTDVAQAVSQIWLALMADDVMPCWTSAAERDALVQTDRELRGWAARDPDAEKAVPLVGQDAFDTMMALLTGKLTE